MKKIFIGTPGYHNLANHSIGSALLPQLQKMQWAEGVEVDEFNWDRLLLLDDLQPNHTEKPK